jgi:hypothetical protein
MSFKYYFIDYTGSGDGFIKPQDTLYGEITDYGGGLYRTNNTGWVDGWNGIEFSHSQAQDFHNTYVTNSLSNILPSNHSESIKYYQVNWTGSMSEFITHEDNERESGSMPILAYSDTLFRTKNTVWVEKVGGIELSQSQAQDYLYQHLTQSTQLPE